MTYFLFMAFSKNQTELIVKLNAFYISVNNEIKVDIAHFLLLQTKTKNEYLRKNFTASNQYKFMLGPKGVELM